MTNERYDQPFFIPYDQRKRYPWLNGRHYFPPIEPLPDQEITPKVIPQRIIVKHHYIEVPKRNISKDVI